MTVMTKSRREPGKSETFVLHVIEPTGEHRPAPGGGAPGEELDLQSGGILGLFYREKEVSSDKLLTSWQNTHKALVLMIESAKKEEEKGIRLEELEVSLSVSAEGNIAFVGAKAEASIVLKFKRS
jgi:hypothetical protein